MTHAHLSSEALFDNGQWVSYPGRGVGIIKATETLEYNGIAEAFYKVEFQDPFLVLRVPTEKAFKNGMRAMGSKKDMQKALKIISENPNTLKGLWIHRAALHEKKIGSGHLLEVAEVIRDLKPLYKTEILSFSDRGLFTKGIARLVGEMTIVEKMEAASAEKKVLSLL